MFAENFFFFFFFFFSKAVNQLLSPQKERWHIQKQVLSNSLLAGVNKGINPLSLSNLLFSPRTSSMSCLLRVSPDLHPTLPAFLSAAEERRSVRWSPPQSPVSQCVPVCVCVCPQAVSSFLSVCVCAAPVFTSLSPSRLTLLGRPPGRASIRHTSGSDSCTPLCRYHRQFLYFEWQSSCVGSSPLLV